MSMSPKFPNPFLHLKIHKKRFLIVGLVLVLMFLVMDLNSRLIELEDLQLERDRIATEAFVFTRTEIAMETEVAYAQSSDAVEDYAEDQQMTNDDGRVLIIPLADTQITPTAQIVATPTALVYEKIEVWKELFFGD